MNYNASRIFWLATGVLLIFAGIYIMRYPSATILALAIFIGISILISGISHIMIYIGNRKAEGSGFLLLEGIMSTAIALIMLFNRFVTASVVPYIFAMWSLVVGTSRMIVSYEAWRAKMPLWWQLFLVGFLCALVGFLAVLNPISSIVAISFILGVMFILHGISLIALWLVSRPTGK